jgi:hypothetical protein
MPKVGGEFGPISGCASARLRGCLGGSGKDFFEFGEALAHCALVLLYATGCEFIRLARSV